MPQDNNKSLFAPPTAAELEAGRVPTNEELSKQEMFSPPTQNELAQSNEDQPPPAEQLSYGTQLAKGAINALPAVGMAGGAALGTLSSLAAGPGAIVAAPYAGVVGAGLGGGAGVAAKNYLNSQFFPEDAPKNNTEALTQPIAAIPEYAAAEMGGQVVGKGLEAAKGALSKTAVGRAASSFGLQRGNAPESVKAQGIKRIEELGKFGIDSGIVKAGDTLESIGEKANALKQEAGQSIGQIHQDVNEQMQNPVFLNSLTPKQHIELQQAQVQPDLIGQKVLDSAKIQFKGKPGSTAGLSKLQSVIDEISQNAGPIDLSKANEIKGSIDGEINYAKRKEDIPIYQQTLKNLRNAFKEAIEKQISVLDTYVGGDKVKELKAANKLYSNTSDVAHIVDERLSRNATNQYFAPSDKATGMLGATAGYITHGPAGAVAGAAGSLASKFGRAYANPMASSAANLLSKTPISPLFLRGAAASSVNPIQQRLRALGGE